MRTFMLFAGPALALVLGWGLVRAGFAADVAWTAGTTVLCASWWIFEPIPIPATSLIPIAVLPAVGVLTPEEVGESYGSPLVLLLLGGFILSTAMAKSGAHRRLALNMVSLFGGAGGRRLVFGFMAAAAVLSMWISNTATTLMLLPIVMAVLEKVRDPRLTISLLLGVAYAASVGGPIAMGYVDSNLSTPGTALTLFVRGRALNSSVTKLPFVPHRYFRKPKSAKR